MCFRIAWIVSIAAALELLEPASRALAQAATAPTSSASSLPLDLDWQAPAGCGSEAEARAELERIAHVRPGVTLERLVARAQVERRAERNTEDNAEVYTVRLSTEHAGQQGERVLDAADCQTLVRTVTLVLALTFGRGVEVEGPPSPAPQGDGPGSTPASTSTSTGATGQAQPAREDRDGEDSEAEDSHSDQSESQDSESQNSESQDSESQDTHSNEPRSADAPRWALLIGGGAQLGLLPSAAFAASAGVELDVGALLVAVRATAWPGVSSSLASDVNARFDGLAGTLQGCVELPVAVLSLALCGGARIAVLRGRSSGAAALLAEREAAAPWYAVHGAAALSWPAEGALQLRIEAALAASLNRPRFVITGLREAHEVPLLAPELSALLYFAL